jgi:hypothetical protein
MITAISNATPAQPVSPPAGTSTKKTTQPEHSAGGKDSVKLSSAAQAQLAALQEATETPSQTAKEAGNGDLQAQRLLAKESAESAKQ